MKRVESSIKAQTFIFYSKSKLLILKTYDCWFFSKPMSILLPNPGFANWQNNFSRNEAGCTFDNYLKTYCFEFSFHTLDPDPLEKLNHKEMFMTCDQDPLFSSADPGSASASKLNGS